MQAMRRRAKIIFTDLTVRFRQENFHRNDGSFLLTLVLLLQLKQMCYSRGRQHMARVPSVARGTIFSGSLSELKYNNYDLKKLNF
jgi:hypothetical protein